VRPARGATRTTRTPRVRPARSVLVLVVLGLVAALAACTGDGGSDGEPEPSATTSAPSVRLTVGVYGSAPEIAAWKAVVRTFNAAATSSQATLKTWPSRAAMVADVESGTPMPDLYLADRRDLPELRDRQLTQPVFDLLDARGISFGDEFQATALRAFTADDNLQCMPYSASPMVMYYNTDLIDFDRMSLRGLPVPDGERLGWDLEEFAAAARFASRPQRGTKGIGIEPTLRSLAPFVYSGGGQVFDDPSDPTSLALSDDDSQQALTQALEVLRDPQLSLTQEQLAKATPEQWFKRGKLGVLEGFRDLTPELRRVDGLRFDTISLPRIDDYATVGDFTGLCLTPGGAINKKADFLFHAISDESFSRLADTGYVVPVKTSVARSQAFLQSLRQPEHASIFNATIDSIQLSPLSDRLAGLGDAVDPLLSELLTTPVLEDVGPLTEQIDEVSRSVLDPDYTPSPGVPSGSPSGSPTGSPSGSPRLPSSPTVPPEPGDGDS